MSELTEDRVRELVREEILKVVAEQAVAAQVSLDDALKRVSRVLPKTPGNGGGGAPARRLAARRAEQGTGDKGVADADQ